MPAPNYPFEHIVTQNRRVRYPQLGPELQFENDPDILRRAFESQGLMLPDELRLGEDPRAESFDEWKE